MINKEHKELSVRRQCKILEISRSGFYYVPKGESALNLELMRLMDEHYLKHPEKGAARMHTWLRKDKGYKVSRNRVERLYYKVMGLRAILPGPHTSKRRKDHPVFPYLLRDLKVLKPMQVWAMDITYLPLQTGFLYLAAIIDVYSRCIVGWSISNTMDAEWCSEVLEKAVHAHGAPEIINTDQGSQFTSETFIQSVKDTEKTRLSMDGKGRAIDNVFIERFWRTIKYEHVYLNPAEDGIELYTGIHNFIEYYNTERRHSSIGDIPPVVRHSEAA